VYALGVMLFVMLAGEHPFGRGAAVSMLVSHVHEPVPALAEGRPGVQVPASLEWVVRSCLAKDPADRFASARELARALKICELEIHGEFEGPVVMALDEGRLVLPEGLDEPAVTGVRAPLTDLPASPSQATLAEPPPPHRPRTLPIAVAVLAALVGVLGLVAWDLARRPPVEEEPSVASTEPVPATRDVWLTTEPGAAHVERDGVFLGDAPVRLAIPDGERWTVDVAHDGYETRSLVLDGSQAQLRVRLAPQGARSVAVPTGAPLAVPGPAPHSATRATPPPPASGTSTAPAAPAVPDWTPTSDVRDPWSE